MAQLQLTATQECDLAVTARDRRGNPATVQDPAWGSSDATTLSVTPDPNDPLKAVAAAIGPTGAVLVTFSGDADLGAGVVPIMGSLDVVVAAGQAVVLEITAGAPREQPA